MKPQQFAEDFLNSTEGKQIINRLNKDFINYIVFGTSEYLNTEAIDNFVKSYKLSTSDIIEKFKNTLTKEEHEQLFSNKPL